MVHSDRAKHTYLSPMIITINDTSIGDLPLIITISDTCKNQPKRLDFDNTINLSSLIVTLGRDRRRGRKLWRQGEGERGREGETILFEKYVQPVCL